LAVIESTIEGRYQVITRVASGGMGEVFRAHDAVLARDVAVKVLHPQLAGDRGFVERFRREARAAAILNHPSIVGVYDWGTTDGTYFMVMEFVQGTNLRSLLTEYGRLEPGQVVEVCLQVLAALDHAHGHGIVHRDVKPENILIARDGLVKVADFGLARAYADSYVSQAEGTVTGTVQYLAPEQIQGEPADPRTDLYALGVVMFELLTGRTPFVGETSLSIAYQHLSGRVPPPSTVLPTVPDELDNVVLSATEKEREQRPASARAMREEILRAGVGAPPAPRVAELAAQLPSVELVPDERAPTVTIPRSLSPRARRARLVRRLMASIVLVALLVGGAWATWVYAIPHYTRVPNVIGLTAQQAEGRVHDAGLVVKTGPGEYSTTVPTGSIIRTTPPPGERIRKGRGEVVLIPSLGPRLIQVPDVSGKSEEEATTILSDAGFKVVVKREYDDTVRTGRVIRQDPGPDKEIQEGSTVTIVVSRGPAPVKIPDVTGRLTRDAKATLEALGFHVEVTQDFSTEVPKGHVISTDPPSGEKAPKGSRVTLFVSKGPKTFDMPDVVGMQREAAVAELERLGLIVNIVEIPGTHGNQVVYQDPDPGVTVEQGQQVTIYVTQP
jgi:beta-lactam-binding protein with PASTA domain/predicted Ser/Thr protein kinase